jgi:small subunit ribosomal protein S21
MPLRMRVHDREHLGAALGRLRELLERRKRKFHVRPCEERRRTELRKQSALRKARAQPRRGSYQ